MLQLLSEPDLKLLSFHIAVRLEDYETEIKREEKKHGTILTAAREQHAKLALIHFKLSPQSLSGQLVLLDGTILNTKKHDL